MTNTPEVTTALALMAEKLSDKKFKEMPFGLRRVFLHILAPGLFKYFNLKEDQKKEFAERYVDTIIAQWCYKEYLIEDKQDTAGSC